MASKVGTADIMWTYELSTDDHEAISFHMGYIKKKKEHLSYSHAIKKYKKKILRILQAAKK